MRPILFAFNVPVVGEVSFPAYFTLLAIGFALALAWTVRDAKARGLDRDLVFDLNLWMFAWGLVGARVLHLVADGHFHDYVNWCVDPKRVKAVDALVAYCTNDAQCGWDYLCNAATHACYPPRDCLAALKLWRGGFAYYGGFIFSTVFAWWFMRRHRMPALRVADLASPAIALGLFFGRMGCFFNGCCYGKVTTSRWGLVFPTGSAAWEAQRDAHLIGAHAAALPVWPTQLFEAIACLVIAAVLYLFVRPRARRDGVVFAWWLILYAVVRSALEVVRDDDRGVFLGGHVSTSQLLSIPLAALGAYLLLKRPAAPIVEPAKEGTP